MEKITTPTPESTLEETFFNSSCPIGSEITIPAQVIHKYLYSSFDNVLTAIFMPIAIGLGSLLNGSLLYTLARIKSMHTPTNFYLANLAICDILYLLSSSYEIRRYFISGTVSGNALRDSHIACIMRFFTTLFYLASMAFVTLVTMERFFAICYSIKNRVLNRKGRTTKLAIATWVTITVVAFVYAMPTIYMETVCINWPDVEQYSHLPKMVGWCTGTFIPRGNKIIPLVIRACKAVSFLTGFVFCSFMCIKIISALGNRPIPKGKEAKTPGHQAERVRHQVARMLLINTTVRFICNIPSCVAHVCNFSVAVTGQAIVSEDAIVTIIQIATVCYFSNEILCAGYEGFIYNSLFFFGP